LRTSRETDRRSYPMQQPTEDSAEERGLPGNFDIKDLPFAIPELAGQLVVNLSNDAGDGVCDATCTLRDAINGANGNPEFVNSISFAASVSHIILNNEIVIGSLSDLRINGPGADLLTIDGGPGTNRIFSSTAKLTIRNLKLTGGNGTGVDTSGHGGAIRVGFSEVSSLTLDRVSVTGNSAIGGGGINVSNSPLHITNSSISGNSAESCGGLELNRSDRFGISNTTISGNNATVGPGGGLCGLLSSIGALRNVTITANTAATFAGGIWLNVGITQASVSLGNSIVANNDAVTVGDEIFCNGVTLTSAGNNLIGASSGDAADTGDPITYQASDILDTPPLLGPLQNNGGPTSTHTLLAGSPAIDAGSSANAVDPWGGFPPLTTDQRGDIFSRRRDGNGDTISAVDIGSVELQNTFIWVGSISNNWNTGSNWDRGTVPNINDNATVTGSVDPVVTQSFQFVGGIKLLNGRKIHIGSNLFGIYGILDLANGGIADNQNQASINNPFPDAIIGAGPSHFIEGPGILYRTVLAGNTYLFPVGLGGVYCPVQFANIVAPEPGQFVVPGISVTPHSGGYPATAGLPENRLQRWWTLSKQFVDQTDITFTYDQNDLVGDEARYKVFRIENGQAVALPTLIDTVNNTATVTGVTQFSDWTLAELTPTAASVSISGRLTTSAGRAIAKASVTLVDFHGNTRFAYTNSLGYFHFDDVQAGQSFVLSVNAKRHVFLVPSRLINPLDNMTGVDFTASP